MQPVMVALSGNALEYMLSLAYVVGGALLGSPAGGEFLVARDAAAQVTHAWKAFIALFPKICFCLMFL